jgi:hypothetical protein
MESKEKKESKAKLKSHFQNGTLGLTLEPIRIKNFAQETRYSSVQSSNITPFNKKKKQQTNTMAKVTEIFNKFCENFKSQIGEKRYNELISSHP